MPQKSMFCESRVPVTREKEYYYPFDPCVHAKGLCVSQGSAAHEPNADVHHAAGKPLPWHG